MVTFLLFVVPFENLGNRAHVSHSASHLCLYSSHLGIHRW